MNLKEIQELIRFISKAGVQEVSIEEKDFKITIKTGSSAPMAMPTGPSLNTFPVFPTVNPPEPSPLPEHTARPNDGASSQPKKGLSDTSRHIAIKAPMIGTFYLTAGPDKPAFVKAGDQIKPGKVLCIIEAMKLFNDIEAEVSGKIVEILVENASPVEYDQPLFIVDPA